MPSEEVPMRRLSGDHPHIDVAADRRRLSAVRAVLVLAAIGATLIAVVADEAAIRVLMGAVALLALAVVGYLALAPRLLKNGVVRIETRGPGLHFRPPVWPTVLEVVLLLMLALPAVAVGAVGVDDLFSVRRTPLVLPVIALVFLGVMLWRVRVAPGLLLTVDGIRGIRARGEIRWTWDEVGAVVVDGPPAALSLTLADGYVPVTASMRYLGSDPNQVAAVVRFFRDHPDERDVLRQGGRAALDRAAEVLRPA